MRRKDDSYRKSLELITEPNIQSVIRRKNWPTLNEILTVAGQHMNRRTNEIILLQWEIVLYLRTFQEQFPWRRIVSVLDSACLCLTEMATWPDKSPFKKTQLFAALKRILKGRKLCTPLVLSTDWIVTEKVFAIHTTMAYICGQK